MEEKEMELYRLIIKLVLEKKYDFVEILEEVRRHPDLDCFSDSEIWAIYANPEI